MDQWKKSNPNVNRNNGYQVMGSIVSRLFNCELILSGDWRPESLY